jgi:NAD(P)H dehydrogenase (quinone)
LPSETRQLHRGRARRGLEKLRAAGAETRLRDLYAEGFDPVLSAREHEIYEDEAINRDPVASHCATLLGATR